MTPIEAVTAADPYPFYANLLREKPLYFDETLKCWVASDARLVADILREPRFKVRSDAERVPHALTDLQSGAVFGSLMRMTEGPTQCPLKSAALDSINDDCAKECSSVALSLATMLIHRSEESSSLDVVRRLMFLLPTFALGACLGIPSNELDWLALTVSTFASGISSLATSEQRILGDSAALVLSERLERLVDEQAQPGMLLRNFVAACQVHSVERKAVLNNMIGFLLQTYDATAGLIGNALCFLARDTEVAYQIFADDKLWRPFIREVLRFDPPVQNTRRYAAEDAQLGDLVARAGDQILLVLAAANRDPKRFASPDRFNLHRAGPAAFGFGLGKHECPGNPLAVEIACAALQKFLTHPSHLQTIPRTVTFRPSSNARIPLL